MVGSNFKMIIEIGIMRYCSNDLIASYIAIVERAGVSGSTWGSGGDRIVLCIFMAFVKPNYHSRGYRA